MNHTERFYFDQRTQEILEHLTIPFAIYQYIDKRVVTIALSQGFCDEFGFSKLEDAYSVMDNDMYRATHPDDKTRVADAAYRFAAFDEGQQPPNSGCQCHRITHEAERVV